jgi:hypothetical protein
MFLWAKHNLSQPLPVAKVDEDHAAMVTTAVHPPGKGDSLADMLAPERIAMGIAVHKSPRP